ncbi:hypothetical protein DM01DRAFT_1331680 [Hesseltinella vesiculosa]|uniref:Uncharacterized protein n=1 Tax=Hesseltinella vesiculosa TaxID=101127 RepID=A0A1X2GW21_9FUNG|nr:hypothetical protein DM01DRAFT_1331680 [Hesseltinella vesiculosa]
MNKSFAGLLRHSRLASYDRTLPQVYTTPKKAKKVGNWGLKRGLPTVVRTNYVTIGDLDTSEHQTPWQSGESQVLFLKRWKQLFPNSKAPSPRRDHVQHNVAAMSPQEFKQFLKYCRQKQPAFQEALKNKEVTAEQVYDYLNCHFNKDLTHEQDAVVGPTYSDFEAGWNYPVQGRVLNNQGDSFAVGIQGIVAKLPRRNVAGMRSFGRDVRDFYVVDAQISSQGRPEVTVHLDAKPSTMNSILNAGSIYFRNPAGPSLDDMFAGQQRSARSADKSSSVFDSLRDTDNIQPNPDHHILMNRIAHLLDKAPAKKDD